MVFIQKKPRVNASAQKPKTTASPKSATKSPKTLSKRSNSSAPKKGVAASPKTAKKTPVKKVATEEPSENTQVHTPKKTPTIGQKRPATAVAAPEKPAKSKKAKKQKRVKTNPNNAVAPKHFFSGATVPQEVKDLFYDLASVKPEIRREAVEKIAKVDLDEPAEKYVLGRLISGCATGHRAARLAFPAALALRLANSQRTYSLDMLLDVTHDRLKIINGVNDQVIGRQCVYAALVHSGKYTATDLLKILKLEAEAFKKYPYLGYYIVETVADIAEAVGAEVFFKGDFATVNFLPKELPAPKDITPELLYLVLRLRKVVKTGKKGVYLNNGKFVFKPADFPEYVRVVKEATAIGVNGSPLPTELYKAAIDAGCSRVVLEGVIMKALLSTKKDVVAGNEAIVNHNLSVFFRLVTEWLTEEWMPVSDALSILGTKNFLDTLNKFDTRLEVPISPVNGPADSILQAALKYFKDREIPVEAAYNVLKNVATICEAEPTGTLQRLKTTKQLLIAFESGIMDTLIEQLLQNPGSPLLHHVLEAFPGSHPKLDLATRIELIAAGGEEFLRNSQGLVTEVLAQSFYKPDRHADLRTYKDTAAIALRSAAKKIAKLDLKEKPKGKLSKHLAVINTTRALLAIMEKLSVDAEDKAAFHQLGEDLVTFASSKIDIDFIVGKAVELVSGRERISRSIGYVLLTEFADLVTSEQIQVLSATVAKVEADPDAEEDDEFAPITAEDLANLEKKKAAAAEEDDEDDSDDESEVDDDSDDELPPLKPEFVAAMKKALGKAAIADSDDEDVAMDDSELAQVDARLSTVMAQFSTAGKKAAKEESKKQRFHVGVLLGIALQSAPMEQVVASFPVIFDLLIAASESNRDDIITPVSHAIGQLCTRLPQLTAELSPMYAVLAEKAAEIHGAKLRSTVQKLATFLFRADFTHDAKSAVKEVAKIAEKYFDPKTPKSAVADVIIGPVTAQHMDFFFEYLGTFFDLFTKTNKKGEAATLIKLLNRKDYFGLHEKRYLPVAKKILAHFKVQPNPGTSDKPTKLITQAFKVFGNKTSFVH